jgi:hypothetical protein
MGRGRQKAKHQKVARELKYHTSTIDVTALERELAGGPVDNTYSDRYDDDEDDDPYAAYTGDDDEDDDED